MKKIVLLFVIVSMLMVGCGSDTAGILSATAPTASNGVVTTTATYTPSSGPAISGQTINFRWYTVGVTSKTQSVELISSGHTDSTGTVTSQYIFDPTVTRTESFIVYVIASTGGLSNIEGWQSVVVAP
jgi:uncharacterized membrane protein YgdD (TMEM256/DUF423 family)